MYGLEMYPPRDSGFTIRMGRAVGVAGGLVGEEVAVTTAVGVAAAVGVGRMLVTSGMVGVAGCSLLCATVLQPNSKIEAVSKTTNNESIR
jgi:hypothetical protein